MNQPREQYGVGSWTPCTWSIDPFGNCRWAWPSKALSQEEPLVDPSIPWGGMLTCDLGKKGNGGDCTFRWVWKVVVCQKLDCFFAGLLRTFAVWHGAVTHHERLPGVIGNADYWSWILLLTILCLVYWFSKNVLSIFCVLGSASGPGHMAVNRMDSGLLLVKWFISFHMPCRRSQAPWEPVKGLCEGSRQVSLRKWHWPWVLRNKPRS